MDGTGAGMVSVQTRVEFFMREKIDTLGTERVFVRHAHLQSDGKVFNRRRKAIFFVLSTTF